MPSCFRNTTLWGKKENNYYLDNTRHMYNSLFQQDQSQIQLSWCQILTAFTSTKAGMWSREKSDLIKFKYRNNLYTLNKNGDNTASKIVFTLGLNHTRECTKIPPHHLTQSSFESRTFQHSPRILIYTVWLKYWKLIIFYSILPLMQSKVTLKWGEKV